MSPKPPLTENQVMEVMRLYKSGLKPAEIAPKFGRTRDSIHRIVTGETYREVTGRNHRPGDKSCDCLTCVMRDRQDANMAIADRAECPVQCQVCQIGVSRRVVIVQRMHGLVLCGTCDGRRG